MTIVELKALRSAGKFHHATYRNQVRGTGISVGRYGAG